MEMSCDKPELELRLNSQTAADAVMPVGWCLRRDLAERLMNSRELHHPHVLLTSVQDGKEVSERKLCPVTQAMTFFPFNRSGRQRVHAFLVLARGPGADAVADLKNQLLSRDGRAYSFSLFNHCGEFPKERLGERLGDFQVQACLPFLAHAETVIEVDEKLFAKKPPDWCWHWANRWFRNPPVDQCDFRKRAIFAFTLQPILWVIGWAFWFLVICPVVWTFLGIFKVLGLMTALLLGLRDINWRTFVPNRATWDGNLWGDNLWVASGNSFLGPIENEKWHYYPQCFSTKRSVFFCNRDGKPRSVFWLVAYPPLILAVGLANWGVLALQRKSLSVEISGLTLRTILSTLGLVLLLRLVELTRVRIERYLLAQRAARGIGKDTAVSDKLSREKAQKAEIERWRWRQEQKEQQRRWRKEAKKRQEQLTFEARMSVVVCTGKLRPVVYETVPRRNRTLRLTWDHIKTRVCRPFSQK